MAFKGLKTETKAEAAPAELEERRDARRFADGMRQLNDAVSLLASLEARLRLVEDEMTAGEALDLDALPGADAVGVAGEEPRLAEAALLIGAMTRRMSLRLGAVERVLDGAEALSNDHGFTLKSVAKFAELVDGLREEAAETAVEPVEEAPPLAASA